MPHPSFVDEVKTLTGISASECYQCFRCTNGCPVAEDMDIAPQKIMAYILNDERTRVLSADALWSCLQCFTCSARCPNGIDIARIIEALRRLALETGMASRIDIRDLDAAMIDSVARYGRIWELGVVMRYRLSHRALFKNIPMAFDMVRKRRIGFFPHAIKQRKRVGFTIRKTVKKIDD